MRTDSSASSESHVAPDDNVNNLLGKKYTISYYNQTFTFSSDPDEVLLALFFNHPAELSYDCKSWFHEIYENGLQNLLSKHDVAQESIDIVFNHLRKQYKHAFIKAFLLKKNRIFPSQQLLMDYLKGVIAREDANYLLELLSEDYIISTHSELLLQLIKFAIEVTNSLECHLSPCLSVLTQQVPKIFNKINEEIIFSCQETSQFLKYRNHLLERCNSKNKSPTIKHFGFYFYFTETPTAIEMLNVIHNILTITKDASHLQKNGKRFIARAVTSEFAFSQYIVNNKNYPIQLSLEQWSMLIKGIEFIASQIQSNIQALVGAFIVKLNDDKTISYCVHIECGMTPCISVKAKLHPHEIDPTYNTDYKFCSDLARAQRNEIYDVEFVNGEQTIPYLPIFQTREVTHLVDICNDANHGSAFTGFLRDAIRNGTLINPECYCYTVIAIDLPLAFPRLPVCTTSVFAGTEYVQLGQIVTNNMKILYEEDEGKHSDTYEEDEDKHSDHPVDYTQVSVYASIQHTTANEFSCITNEEQRTEIRNTLFFYKPLGSVTPRLLNKNLLQSSSGAARFLGGTINATLFAHSIDVEKHNRSWATLRAHNACVSSGFFKNPSLGV